MNKWQWETIINDFFITEVFLEIFEDDNNDDSTKTKQFFAAVMLLLSLYLQWSIFYYTKRVEDDLASAVEVGDDPTP